MELCTAQANLKLPRFSPFTAGRARFQQFQSDSPVPNTYGLNFKLSGLPGYDNLSLKVSSSDESSVSSYAKDGPDGVITLEETRPVEKEEYADRVSNAVPEENPSEENLTQLFESFLGKLDIDKFDSEDKYSLLLLGGGGLAALYLVISVVGAIDSIPLVPKLMQVVGLSYTVWFTSRYLVLKKTRAELAAKIKDIKAQVLGSDDD